MLVYGEWHTGIIMAGHIDVSTSNDMPTILALYNNIILASIVHIQWQPKRSSEGKWVAS